MTNQNANHAPASTAPGTSGNGRRRSATGFGSAAAGAAHSSSSAWISSMRSRVVVGISGLLGFAASQSTLTAAAAPEAA
jgi:hypothetical protein